MPDQDVIELPDAIRMVQGLSSWLLKAGPIPLAYRDTPEAEPIVYVLDANRAGRVLNILMITAGMA